MSSGGVASGSPSVAVGKRSWLATSWMLEKRHEQQSSQRRLVSLQGRRVNRLNRRSRHDFRRFKPCRRRDSNPRHADYDRAPDFRLSRRSQSAARSGGLRRKASGRVQSVPAPPVATLLPPLRLHPREPASYSDSPAASSAASLLQNVSSRASFPLRTVHRCAIDWLTATPLPLPLAISRMKTTTSSPASK